MDDASPIDWRVVDDHVVVITLADEATRNSLTPAMIDAICDALARFDRDPALRCAILTGQGGSFCSGGNPKRMLEPVYRDATPGEIVQRYRDSFHRIPRALDGLSKPIVAAINGHAIGAGLDLASYCDIRVACEEARFASSFVKLGLIPGDGGAWILPRVIGRSMALQLMLTGEAIDAARAASIGLVSAAVPRAALLDAALHIARSIAANPPHATRMAKELERASAQLDLPAALDLAAHMQVAAHKSADHIEAVSAMLDGRTPVFGKEDR